MPIQSKRFIETLDRVGLKQFKRVVGDNALKKLIARSIEDIAYDLDAAEDFLQKEPFKSSVAENAYRFAVQCLKDKHWLFTQDRQGRLYHNLTQMGPYSSVFR